MDPRRSEFRLTWASPRALFIRSITLLIMMKLMASIIKLVYSRTFFRLLTLF